MIRFTLLIFSLALLTACNALQKEVYVSPDKVNLLPEPIARAYLNKFDERNFDRKVTQLHACRFSEETLNDRPYDKVTYKFYDRSLNLFTKISGHKFKLVTNTGCVIASNDQEEIDKLTAAFASLGTQSVTTWSQF